jgi:hypothetical protein
MKVSSNPNIVQILVVFGAGGIVFVSLGTFIIFIVAPEYALNKQIGLTLIGLGFYTFSLFASIGYFKAAPSITVTLDEVSIKYINKTKTIKTEEIKTIRLSQKSYYRFLFFSVPMESTIIELKNGDSIVFWDFLYEQFGGVKNALNLSIQPDKHEKLNEIRKSKRKIENVSSESLRSENFISLKGNGLLNFYGLVLVGMFGFLLYNLNNENYVRAIIIYPLIVLGSGFHLHYYRISDNYFQIKNHIWFWKTLTYKLEDIIEIIHEHPTNTPESIRVRLKNYYTTSLQPAGSYKDKHWKELKAELEKKNIKFRSEYYNE